MFECRSHSLILFRCQLVVFSMAARNKLIDWILNCATLTRRSGRNSCYVSDTGCSSGFWRRVDSSIDANVSEKHTVSIFRSEVQSLRWRPCVSPKRHKPTSLTRRQNPEEHHHPHRRENLSPITYTTLLTISAHFRLPVFLYFFLSLSLRAYLF
jgi:hypothetical protein